jgi:aminopeptidase YwaD
MRYSITLILAFCVSLHLIAQNADLTQQLEKHVSFLSSDSLQGRGLGTQGKVLAMHYIADQFRAIGLLTYNDSGYYQNIDLKLGLARVPAVNVVGWLKGSDPLLQNQYVVIGAHYDHLGYSDKPDGKEIFHGADDNASGVAGMIELARFYASHPELVKRSLIFIAFDAEESGLLGSNAFVKENDRFEISEIKAMFSLDMIGMYHPNHGLDLDGIGTVTGGDKLAGTIAYDKGIILKKTTSNVEMRTDTWPFGQKGIPAVHVFTGSKSPYHKPEDTYEKLDYEGMAMVVEYLEALTGEIQASPEINPANSFSRASNPHHFRFNGGITAGLGSSRMKYPEEYYNPKPIFSYNAGLFMQFHLGNIFCLQPAVLFQSDGSKSSQGTFRRQSIFVPVDIQVNIIDQYEGMIRVYPFLGAYYLNTFSGKNGDESLDYNNTVSKDEWGMDIGLGTDIMDWQISFTWRRALTNLSLEPDSKIFPAMWFLSVGYKF